MEKTDGCKVCVTGGTGYVASLLVKKLLDKGYTVHVTLRSLDDVSKVSLLRSLPNSDERLVLFEADIYNPVTFEQAIEGCKFVFHLATPFSHNPNSQYKDITEASVAATKSIAEACRKSGTCRRLIYTSSVVAASPLKKDGSEFKDIMDETCWTPLDNLPEFCSNHALKNYTISKTITEREVLSYGNHNDRRGLEVVSLDCGLVGGSSVPHSTPETVGWLVSFLKSGAMPAGEYSCIIFLEELLGKIPLVHVDDVCDAHIFCMESPSLNGRFLCASSYVSSAQIASCYRQQCPELEVKQERLDLPNRQVGWGSNKLTDEGFVYKYDTSRILDDCIKSARKWGSL